MKNTLFRVLKLRRLTNCGSYLYVGQRAMEPRHFSRYGDCTAGTNL